MTKNLQTIEQALALLWTQNTPRSQFLEGSSSEGVEGEIVPQIDPRGVRLYASLIRIGRQDLMRSIYPGCQKILSRQWVRLVDKYMETCPPEHYNLNQAAKGFSQFLRDHEPELVARHQFLPELADYEWIELEILESDKKAERGVEIQLDNPEVFKSYGPILNTVLVVRNYQYPISKLVDWLRDDVRLPRRVKKDRTNLAIYRDPEELNARFLELGDLTAKMISRIEKGPVSYAELLMLAVAESKSKNPQETVVQTLELFEQLMKLNVILGSGKI